MPNSYEERLRALFRNKDDFGSLQDQPKRARGKTLVLAALLTLVAASGYAQTPTRSPALNLGLPDKALLLWPEGVNAPQLSGLGPPLTEIPVPDGYKAFGGKTLNALVGTACAAALAPGTTCWSQGRESSVGGRNEDGQTCKCEFWRWPQCRWE